MIQSPHDLASATIPLQVADHNANVSAVSTGGYEFAGVPKIDDPYKKRQWQLEHMAGAFRVLSRKNFSKSYHCRKFACSLASIMPDLNDTLETLGVAICYHFVLSELIMQCI